MIFANTQLLRYALVQQMYDLRGKITYTQDCRRDLVEEGYGDCSSVVRWVYRKILHMDIGEDTAVQILSDKGFDVDEGPYPKICRLLPGDLLFFTGGDEMRPMGVGHVEMYAGCRTLIGQNGREEKGTFIKDIDEYMAYIKAQGLQYIKARRFIR